MENDRQLPPAPASPTTPTSIFARFQARYASSRSSHSPTASPPLSETAAKEEVGVSLVVGEKSVEECGEEAVEEFGVELEQAADGEGAEGAAETSQERPSTESHEGECLESAGGGGSLHHLRQRPTRCRSPSPLPRTILQLKQRRMLEPLSTAQVPFPFSRQLKLVRTVSRCPFRRQLMDSAQDRRTRSTIVQVCTRLPLSPSRKLD